MYIVIGLNADGTKHTSYHETYTAALNKARDLHIVYHYQSISIRRVGK